MSELKPCAHCGSAFISDGNNRVACRNCGMQTRIHMVDPHGLWNTRTPDWQRTYEDERQARLSLQNLAADECEVAAILRGLLSEACCYVTDALDAYEHTDGRDLLGRITDALKNTRAAPDWQDISTAPRDGTKVLLYEDGSYYAGESEGADGYWTSYCGQYVVRDPEPTHWIPLPAPPKEGDQ